MRFIDTVGVEDLDDAEFLVIVDLLVRSKMVNNTNSESHIENHNNFIGATLNRILIGGYQTTTIAKLIQTSVSSYEKTLINKLEIGHPACRTVGRVYINLSDMIDNHLRVSITVANRLAEKQTGRGKTGANKLYSEKQNVAHICKTFVEIEDGALPNTPGSLAWHSMRALDDMSFIASHLSEYALQNKNNPSNDPLGLPPEIMDRLSRWYSSE